MDLGCFDMGCVETQRKDASPEKDSSSSSTTTSSGSSTSNSSDSVTATSKIGKNKASKEPVQSSWNALNKCTSQIKKPPRRKTSPLNWFPRKKVDSYLKRKIKLLQEVDGMNSTLDETLGDSNPHYSKVLKEKIAVKEAASKAIEARKAAMVEASWCRILKAARIDCNGAEAQLFEAEKTAAEAFEAATAIGVTVYDIPGCPQKHYKIETAAAKGGGSTTHTVSASFETAFEVDKQVACAVKAALTKLANCPSIKKDDFRELLRKISQNPDSDENFHDFSEFTSDYESDTGSDFEVGLHGNGCGSQNNNYEKEISGVKQRKYKKMQVSEKFNMSNLEEMMLERLKCLQEDELASLATIVATCGLNAALAEVENNKKHYSDYAADHGSDVHARDRMSVSGVESVSQSSIDGQMRMKKTETELPSLDKFLVKRLTRLEREVLEAKNARMNEAKEGNKQRLDNKFVDDRLCSLDNTSSDYNNPDSGSNLQSSSIFEQEIEGATKKSREMYKKDHKNEDKGTSASDLGTILVKHSSKLEKEIEEARRNEICSTNKKLGRICSEKQDATEFPSLDKFLVKHVSRLEKEVQEAKSRKNFVPLEGGGKVTDSRNGRSFTSCGSAEEILLCSAKDSPAVGKENIDLNENVAGEDEQPSRKAAEELSLEGKINGSKEAEKCHDKILAKPDNAGQRGDTLQEPSLKAAEELSLEGKINGSKEAQNCHDKILAKPDNAGQRGDTLQESSLKGHSNIQKQHIRRNGANGIADFESLDKVLVKHVSRLEREKMEFSAKEGAVMNVKRRETKKVLDKAEGGQESSLDQVLVKHKSRLEREKMIAAAQQSEDDQIRHSVVRREARQKELQEAWGGLSLGNSMRPHLSRLQRDKAAWLKAEEEERRRAMETS